MLSDVISRLPVGSVNSSEESTAGFGIQKRNKRKEH